MLVSNSKLISYKEISFENLNVDENIKYYQQVNEWGGKRFNGKSKSLFYPFGGIDLLFPLNLFVSSGIEEFIIFSQEQAYPYEDIDQEICIEKFEKFIESSTFIKSGWATSYKEKEDEYTLECLKEMGIANVLLMMLKLFKLQVTDISTYKDFENSVSITFRHDGVDKKLVYLSTDLSNEGLNNNDVYELISELATETVFIKAAHYNLYKESFSTLRDLIIDNFSHLVQDQTGIHLLDLINSNPIIEDNIRVFGSIDQIDKLYYEVFDNKSFRLDSFLSKFHSFNKECDIPFNVSYVGSNCLISASRA